MNLDFNPEELRQALNRTADLIVDLYVSVDDIEGLLTVPR